MNPEHELISNGRWPRGWRKITSKAKDTSRDELAEMELQDNELGAVTGGASSDNTTKRNYRSGAFS